MRAIMRDYLDRLDKCRDEQLDFLARLVNQDSGTDDRADVNKVGAVLAEVVAGLGFTVTRVPQERFGDHLLAEKPGTGPKRFLFVGHFDTVFAAGTARERPFRIAEGRAFGPGVYDMKGGLAVLLYALRPTGRRGPARSPRPRSRSSSTPTRSGYRPPRAISSRPGPGRRTRSASWSRPGPGAST
jgi:acetylornithine deacetylase/succinyl-diaminopimelate desuccinylase-like protein